MSILLVFSSAEKRDNAMRQISESQVPEYRILFSGRGCQHSGKNSEVQGSAVDFIIMSGDSGATDLSVLGASITYQL